jgi:uncharacterized protein
MDAVYQEIQDRLSAAERKHGVRVVYACESGSRAWGFASADSDWDVRFLYVHEAAWYMRVRPGRDVIEQPIVDDLDVSGWDLRKALGLFRKSNPPLLEWLQSPLVYRDDGVVADRLRRLAHDHFDAAALQYHYVSMARKSYAVVRGPRPKLKKVLYTLRPLLAVRWLEQGRGLVPVEFARLRAVLPEVLRASVDDLVEAKKAGEGVHAPVSSELVDWLGSEIERHGRFERGPERMPAEPLDELLVSVAC